MLKRKRISRDGIPTAMEKALRYRLLNESLEAESICLDVLDVEPDNCQALVTMLLALTDQFATEISQPLARAKELLPRLANDYEREYYRGIINERWAKAQMGRNVPDDVVFSWFREALACFERAMALADPDDPDATLRWNTCVHILDLNPHIRPSTDSLQRDVTADFGDDMPMR